MNSQQSHVYVLSCMHMYSVCALVENKRTRIAAAFRTVSGYLSMLKYCHNNFDEKWKLVRTYAFKSCDFSVELELWH